MTTINELKPFGAEVLDVDLHEPGRGDEVGELFREYGVVVVRNQRLTFEEHQDFIRSVGPVCNHWTMTNYVSNRREDGYLGDAKVSYHSDAAYCEEPALAITLHAVDLEDEGQSATLLASGINAYEQLPDNLRARIEDLKVLNHFALDTDALAGKATRDGYPEDGPHYEHPVAIVDPITGRRSIYTTYQNAAAIVGLDDSESDALIEELQSYVYAPDNIYEHLWYAGDLLMWSNMGFHHARGKITGGTRTLSRVCIAAGAPEMYDVIPVMAERKGAAR